MANQCDLKHLVCCIGDYFSKCRATYEKGKGGIIYASRGRYIEETNFHEAPENLDKSILLSKWMNIKLLSVTKLKT